MDGMKRAVEAAVTVYFAGHIPRNQEREQMQRAIEAAAPLIIAALPLVGVEREDVARAICYWDPTGTCHDNYCVNKCIAIKPDEWFFQAADAVLPLPLPKHTGQPQEGWREALRFSDECDWDYLERLLASAVRHKADSQTRYWVDAIKELRKFYSVTPASPQRAEDFRRSESDDRYAAALDADQQVAAKHGESEPVAEREL